MAETVRHTRSTRSHTKQASKSHARTNTKYICLHAGAARRCECGAGGITGVPRRYRLIHTTCD